MKKTSKLALIYITVFVIIFLAFNFQLKKNKKNNNYYSTSFFSMDTIVELNLNVKDKKELQRIVSSVKEEFFRIERKFSTEYRKSIVYKINHRKSKKVKVDKETELLIENALTISKLTGGRFDVTVEPLVRVYGFYSKHYRVPGEDEIKTILKKVSYKNIKKISTGVYEFDNGVRIDLGGIAKGYAVDKAYEILIKMGIKDFLINAGGEIRVYGKNKKGKLWRIGIKNPRGYGIVKVFKIRNSSIATSGDYERFFIKDGVRYYHIVSPFDGRPWRKGWESISIISKDCIIADALSTAFFGVEKKEVKKILKKLSEKFGKLIFYGMRVDEEPVFVKLEK